MTIICFLGTLSVTANAQVVVITPPVNNPSNPSLKDTYYERVKNLFAKGTLPEASELVEYNVGRCFFRTTPNKAVNGFIYGRTDHSIGPIDVGSVTAESFFSPSEKVGYFDNMTAEEIGDYLRLAGVDLGRMLPVRSTGTSLLVDNDVSTVQTWEVRKSSTYLVYHLGSYAYCYTFIKH